MIRGQITVRGTFGVSIYLVFGVGKFSGPQIKTKITETVQKKRTLDVTYCNIDDQDDIPVVCTHALYTDCDCTVRRVGNMSIRNTKNTKWSENSNTSYWYQYGRIGICMVVLVSAW